MPSEITIDILKFVIQLLLIIDNKIIIICLKSEFIIIIKWFRKRVQVVAVVSFQLLLQWYLLFYFFALQ